MNEPVRTKSHEEWLELRRKGIGSSEVATILGLNPFDTPYLLWRRKRGELAEEPESEAMLMGHMLEDVVAKRWQRETGLEILPGSEEEILFVDEERPFMRVSPDRLYRKRPDGDEGILECKTTVKAVSPDEIPLHWFVQLQYQLGVAGMAKGSLAWLVQGRHFGQLEMDFVKDYFDNELKRPEILGRIGYENIVPFNFINDPGFAESILKSKIKPVQDAVREKYGIELRIRNEHSFYEYILSSTDAAKGGRDILNALDAHLLTSLAQYLFLNYDDLDRFRGSTLTVHVGQAGLEFDVER